MKNIKKLCLKISLIFFLNMNTQIIHPIIYECINNSYLSKISEITNLHSFVIFHDNVLIKSDTFFNPRFDIYHQFINYFLEKIGIKTNNEIDEFMANALINSQPKINDIAKNIINSLHIKNIKVVALSNSKTGKWHAIESKEDFRINELNNCGFNFSSALEIPQMHFILNEQNPENSPFIKNGVIFTNSNLEELTLYVFFNYLQKQKDLPTNQIIYVDNNMNVIIEIEKIFKQHFPQTKFIGIYDPINQEQEKPCWFDILKLKTQIEMLSKNSKQWPSDEFILQLAENWTSDQKKGFTNSVKILFQKYKPIGF